MKKLTILILLAMAVVCRASAQNRVVTGTVSEEDGTPLTGAVVQVVGTNNAATAAIDGLYTLKNVPSGAVLRVSFLGYEPVEKKVDADRMDFIFRFIKIAQNGCGRQARNVVLTRNAAEYHSQFHFFCYALPVFLTHTYTDTIIRHPPFDYNVKIHLNAHCSHKIYIFAAPFLAILRQSLDETVKTTYDKEKEF